MCSKHCLNPIRLNISIKNTERLTKRKPKSRRQDFSAEYKFIKAQSVANLSNLLFSQAFPLLVIWCLIIESSFYLENIELKQKFGLLAALEAAFLQ